MSRLSEGHSHRDIPESGSAAAVLESRDDSRRLLLVTLDLDDIRATVQLVDDETMVAAGTGEFTLLAPERGGLCALAQVRLVPTQLVLEAAPQVNVALTWTGPSDPPSAQPLEVAGAAYLTRGDGDDVEEFRARRHDIRNVLAVTPAQQTVPVETPQRPERRRVRSRLPRVLSPIPPPRLPRWAAA